MKKHWKLFTTPLIVALSLASLQASHGDEKRTEEDKPSAVSLSLARLQVSQATEQESNLETLRATSVEAREPADTGTHPLIDLGLQRFPEIGLVILKYAVMGLCCEFNNANKLANVSKGWLAFIKGERQDASTEYTFHFPKGILEEYTPKTFEECCKLQVFLDSKFVFLSKKAGRIEFPIASFPNPFRISLDLFEHTGPYHVGLEIGTGSREVC
jgi:hypothetical protein